ncbi:hypothetical protein NIES73_19950 [Sphaerospermopsis kisseleviana NIES-73]|nr:hypothetical protein NIES73_19950 [Sphaerospermopsis kisseleviana NIES-73]
MGINLETIGKIQNFAQENNSKFILAMTPLFREIGEPRPRDYEIVARKRLSDFTKEQPINYIDSLPQFNSIYNPESLYHDSIHLNLKGNHFVSEVISCYTAKLYNPNVLNSCLTGKMPVPLIQIKCTTA